MVGNRRLGPQRNSASSLFQRVSDTVRSSVLALLVVGLALLLALLPLPFAVLLVAATIGGVLALIDPVWAVCWAVLSVPVQELAQLPGGLTVTQATLVVAAGSWLLRSLATPQRFVRWGPLGLPFAALLAAHIVSTAFTPYSPIEGVKETLRWVWVALVYWIVLNCTSNRRQRQFIVAALLLAPTAEALYGVWQFVTASGPPSFLIAGGRFARAYGTIGQPNSFAGYMNMSWPLAAALGASVFVSLWQLVFKTGDKRQETRDKEIRRQEAGNSNSHSSTPPLVSPVSRLPSPIWSLVGAGAAVVLLGALGASFSRGGWVGAVGGGAALLFAALVVSADQRSRTQIQGRIVVAACAGLVVVLLVVLLNNAGVLPVAVANRLDSIVSNIRLFDVRTVDVTPANFAVVERMAHIQAGWGMFTAYPLLGVGPGNFTPAYPDFSIPPWVISQGHAHNYYLNTAAEGGIVGALAYLWLLVAVVRLCIRALRHADQPFDRLLAIGGCGMMGAVVVHNLFENLHVLNLPLQLGAMWGLLAVIANASDTSQGMKK